MAHVFALRGDAGFSSRNSDYIGAADAEIDYMLKNGQQDWYPAAWALPLTLVNQALDYSARPGQRRPSLPGIMTVAMKL